VSVLFHVAVVIVLWPMIGFPPLYSHILMRCTLTVLYLRAYYSLCPICSCVCRIVPLHAVAAFHVVVIAFLRVYNDRGPCLKVSTGAPLNRSSMKDLSHRYYCWSVNGSKSSSNSMPGSSAPYRSEHIHTLQAILMVTATMQMSVLC
jgi:hypothetical protein